MILKAANRYSLNTDVTALTDDELRDLKFSLNYRWIGHMQKDHTKAAESAKAVTDAIRAELAQRVADRQLDELTRS